MLKQLCPCCSGELYADCCQPYHKHKKYPINALALMRSRYSAYAQGSIEYIIETTHPQNPSYQTNTEEWTKSLRSFSVRTHFQGLEIVEFVDGPDKAFVTFNAILEQEGRNVSFTEKSGFVKTSGRWLYLGGVVKTLPR